MADQGQPELMKLQVVKKSYVFSIGRRFSYVKQARIVKHLQETQENPYFRKIRLAVYKMMGRKEE